ncbi:MAG: hypothetical protein Q9220_005435 [cf. Caloplaca sp. 1 TL-2023]
MFFTTLLPLLLAPLLTTSTPTPSYYPRNPGHPVALVAPYCPPRPATPAQQHAIFTSFVSTLYTSKNVSAAFENYIAVDLIEHDPTDAQGRAANEAKLSQIVPFVPSVVLRQGFDNGTGFIHLKVLEEGHLPIALADIYRMNGSCIVEHWE